MRRARVDALGLGLRGLGPLLALAGWLALAGAASFEPSAGSTTDLDPAGGCAGSLVADDGPDDDVADDALAMTQPAAAEGPERWTRLPRGSDRATSVFAPTPEPPPPRA